MDGASPYGHHPVPAKSWTYVLTRAKRAVRLSSRPIVTSSQSRSLPSNSWRVGVKCFGDIRGASMDAPGSGWITTEKTHPQVWKIPLGIDLFLALIVILIVAVSPGPRPGIQGALGLFVIFALTLGFVDVVLVIIMRPTEVRFSADSIEVRRMLLGIVRFSAESVPILRHDPEGFGFLPVGWEGGGYFLSPNQMKAARVVLPGRVFESS